LIGADAASIAGIVRVTALRMMTSGMATMATMRLMLVECWGLLLVVNVKAVEGGLYTRRVEIECGSWWMAQ
jgi:hypothetical protein